jgi:hypothetical protein
MKATKPPLEVVESDLKELMAEVSRAIEKAQAAMAKLASGGAAAGSESEPTLSSR